jgi:3-dehydroquinate dehydratase-2
MRVLLLNGPNLNMLGTREPHLYGYETLTDIEAMCQDEARLLNIALTCRQTNHEGELVTWIQEARGQYEGIIINPAAYTHTSIAIHDALAMLSIPIIEVHLSNIHRRESFRHNSYVSLVAKAIICGLGSMGYILALQALYRLNEVE